MQYCLQMDDCRNSLGTGKVWGNSALVHACKRVHTTNDKGLWDMLILAYVLHNCMFQCCSGHLKSTLSVYDQASHY